jgi:hypothetical protein
MYKYFGNIINHRVHIVPLDLGFSKDISDAFFTIVVDDPSTECFTKVVYSDKRFCVPRKSKNTKMALSLLHELANLYTRPTNTQQPNSGTVRVTQ